MTQQQEDYLVFEEVGKTNHWQGFTREQELVRQENAPVPGDYASLYDELKDKCNPSRFMHPYDKKKVDVANEIYEQASAYIGDSDMLKNLRQRAISELNVEFATERLYTLLKTACNPELYTGENYQAEKLRQANNLYAQILEKANDIVALESIEQDAKEFIDDQRKRYAFEQKKKREEELKKKKREEELRRRREEELRRRREEEAEAEAKGNRDSAIVVIALVIVLFLMFVLISFSYQSH